MNLLLISIFVIGYGFIAFENSIKINKSATAMITGIVLWVVYILFADDKNGVNEQLAHHLGEISGILFFLLGAMGIVELIDAHDGFEMITTRIVQLNKTKLLWITVLITFFLSSVIDNLTTAIVVGSLLRKLIYHEKDRVYFMGLVVIAANAGGAWSPIGDVTTTMLWIGGQISAPAIIMKLFLPAITCTLVPLILVSTKMKGEVTRPESNKTHNKTRFTVKQKMIVFYSGIGSLLSVPIFKTFTHLPPYMGILFGLGILWIITEIIHGKNGHHEDDQFSVAYALRKIDSPSMFFFFGILISIAALQTAGVLASAATWLTIHLNNNSLIVLSLGILSAIVDNVPLVAAVQAMYDLSTFPMNHYFWEFLAYAAGTGGSILIIGSAAGVVAMGIEKITFMWYLKHMSLLALAGYFAGAVIYVLQDLLLFSVV
ncbi:MAG: sodium:proton antiporter NhaD [bacterium]|nr:sodium:proton antiporter NhaD [bacterium]